MPRKENTKAKTWERDRRKRMNGYFKNLSDLLPPQLEGRKRNKIDILIHASKYIKDLHNRTDELFFSRASEAHKEELARLKKLVSQLISRTQLLSDLLKNAGITVPAEPALEKISPLKWSNKINVVSGSKPATKTETNKRREKKKDKNSNTNKNTVEINKTDKQPTHNKVSSEKTVSNVENQENQADSSTNEKNDKEDKVTSNEESTNNDSSSESSPPKQDIKNHKKVKRKGKGTEKKVIKKATTEINSFPAGTLVFPNGKIMPVVTPMQSLTSNIIVNPQPRPSNQIILNNTPQGQMIVVQPLQTNHFQTVSTMQTMTLNAVPNIQANMLINPQDWASNVKTIINSSKIGGTKGILPKIREVTETTMAYKVPIPAIHKEKSEKNESKATSPEKQTKTKSISKTSKNNKLASIEIQSDSKNVKDNSKSDNDSKTKSSVNKQSMKRNSNISSNEQCETKKKKIKFSEGKSVQIKENVILDNTVTCKSIENLKQVIEKIGEDVSYAMPQSKDELVKSNTATSNPEEQRTDNNLLKEPSNTSETVNKSEEEKINYSEAYEENKSLNTNSSETLKISSEKDSSCISDFSEQSENGFSKKNSNDAENTNNKNSSLATVISSEHDCKSALVLEKTDVQLSAAECSIDENIILSNDSNQNCNIENRLDNMLQSNNQSQIINEQIQHESNKIFLNLDTNTTTTMKLENSENKIDTEPPISTSPAIKISNEEESDKLKNSAKEDQNIIKTVSYSPSNSFVPINHKTDSLHSDLSNDIFASLQVPSSSNNSESISPTAAFLMAFPIVSSLSGKTEVLDDEMKDDFKYSSQTPPMLLQIGAIEPNNFKINSRTSANEGVETTEPPEMNIQPQVKSSTETITTTTNSSTVTTPVKILPRVISSQTLTESFKIIPVSSEQVNRQLNIEANNSLQSQVPTSNHNDTINREHTSMVTNTINRSLNNTVHNYPLESKTQSNFNYMKDIPLTSISSSMANDILNKYISTTTLSTNTIATETPSKYNTISQFVSQECQTTVSNCVKDNLDRSNNQFNFSCANDIPTERDLCKLQICPMEEFTERSNKYSSRSKENSFSNVPVPSSSQPSNKNIHLPVNSSSNTKLPVQNNESSISSNSFHSIKKLESKEPSSNSEVNVYEKKTLDIPHSSSYVGACDNKVGKKMMPTTSQSNTTAHKIITSRSNNNFSQHPEPYAVSSMTTNYEENAFARTTTTAASTTSNFSILSWTTFSPLNSNNNTSTSTNFSQFDQNPIAMEVPKSICENFNYLPLPKENPPPTNPSYSTVDSQLKAKPSLDMQKRSYNDLNKSRNMRLSQSVSMQKSSRTTNQDFKIKYKYPMDVEFAQNNSYPNLDLAPHQQQQSHQQPQQQQQQQQPQQQQQQHHQQSHGKGSSNQSLHPAKTDKSGYMLPDYDTHTNFSSDSSNVQPRYSNSHDVYSGASFKYGEKSQQVHFKNQTSTATLHQDPLYNNNKQHIQPQQQQPQQSQSSQSKAKDQIQSAQQQQQQVHQQQTMRPPVNWMMTPEIKHNSNIADIILPPIGKELDFCQNNIFSQTPSYNQSSANHQFYNNYEMTSHTFPNIPVLQSESKRTADPPYYQDEQVFSWSPSKNLSQPTEQTQSHKSNVPDVTTPLSSFVGDLALGGSNSLPDKQNFLFGQMPIRSSATTNDQLVQSKNVLKEKEATTTSGRDYQTILNPQNPQHHSSHGMPFLSVSQLVDHEKAEKQHQHSHNSTSQHQHTSHHHHQSHHHQQQQQQPQQTQQQPQQPSRKQRKNNTSPRASGKRQIEMRQKQSTSSSSDHIHRQQEEVKSTSATSSFADNNYQQQPQHQQQQQQQQQKYNQQSNDQWRNRNCKSNYTAEALIGTNTSHTDNSHIEKNLPKYSTNYTQNKLSSSLSTDPMSINYFPNVANVEDPSAGYGQVMNQNFNHSYAYSSNANIYPTGNFITNISNSSSNYMMSLHEGTPDYLDSNNFLLPPNVSTTSITTPLLSNMTDVAKSHHHHSHHHHHHHQPYVSGKHQNCDKRPYFGQQKKSKRKVDAGQAGSVVGSSASGGSAAVQNFDFPISGISSPLDDYHAHASTFLPPPNPLYQNQTNVYAKSTLAPPPPPPPPPATASTSSGSQGVSTSSNPMAMTQHHASTTSLTNFNLSTIFPEINDKVTGYKASTNAIASGIGQPTSHASTTYSQRTNYSNPLGQMSQTSESTTHFNNGGTR